MGRQVSSLSTVAFPCGSKHLQLGKVATVCEQAGLDLRSKQLERDTQKGSLSVV